MPRRGLPELYSSITGIFSSDEEASTLQGPIDEARETVLALRKALQEINFDFLKLEKFANLNIRACYKILKKHDKLIPATVCCRYYLQRLHRQPWIRNDLSAIFVVQISDLFSALRGSPAPATSRPYGYTNTCQGAQAFVRTTRKYWIATEDVSGVKQAIAQHLPVFLTGQEKDRTAATDSQMTSSVYLDSVDLGLYHSRLRKQPGAIALRLRWYGTYPEDTHGGVVFVERKTHRESWTGEESVKERFELPHELVVPFITGDHTWEAEEIRLLSARSAMSDVELASVKALFTEVQRAVESKQLQPTLRTAYMRTAFQVPNNTSVRCSLDTSLAMMVENQLSAEEMRLTRQWHRDAEVPLHRTEMTRFPHAVLEIKLALEPGVEVPGWVEDLVSSGLLTEVHKFSKYMHGCAALFPDIVQEVPYWVDDVSLRQSLQLSATTATDQPRPDLPRLRASVRSVAHSEETPASLHRQRFAMGESSTLTHPLLTSNGDDAARSAGEGGHAILDLMGDSRAATVQQHNGEDDDSSTMTWRRVLCGLFRRCFGFPRGEARRHRKQVPRAVPMRIEPKTYFANERTFLSWLHMAVLIGSVGAALVGVHLGSTTNPGVKGIGAGEERVLTVVHKHEYWVNLVSDGGGSAMDFADAIASKGRSERGQEGVNNEAVINETMLSRLVMKCLQRSSLFGDGGGQEDTSGDVDMGHVNEGQPKSGGGRETFPLASLAIAMTMLSASVLLCVYATWTFMWRGRMITKRATIPFHDPVGPVVMGCAMCGAMLSIIILAAVERRGQGLR